MYISNYFATLFSAFWSLHRSLVFNNELKITDFLEETIILTMIIITIGKKNEGETQYFFLESERRRVSA